MKIAELVDKANRDFDCVDGIDDFQRTIPPPKDTKGKTFPELIPLLGGNYVDKVRRLTAIVPLIQWWWGVVHSPEIGITVEESGGVFLRSSDGIDVTVTMDDDKTVFGQMRKIRSAIIEKAWKSRLQKEVSRHTEHFQELNDETMSYLQTFVDDLVGGAGEGSMTLELMLETLLQFRSKQAGLPTEFPAESGDIIHRTLMSAMKMNGTPQSVLDNLMRLDKNPYTTDEIGNITLTKAADKFLQRCGDIYRANPEITLQNMQTVFHAITNALVDAYPHFGGSQTVIKAMLSRDVERAVNQLQNQASALTVIWLIVKDLEAVGILNDKQKYQTAVRYYSIFRILDKFLASQLCPGEKTTLGCPLRVSGIAKEWSDQLVGYLGSWYRQWYERCMQRGETVVLQ